MAKKPNVAGFAAGAAATQTTIKKIENEVNSISNNTSNDIEKEIIKPARKKKNPTYQIKRKNGKIEIITKAEQKVNKTYYLEQSCVDTIEDISNNTGLNPSEIIKIAIQELNAKLMYSESKK